MNRKGRARHGVSVRLEQARQIEQKKFSELALIGDCCPECKESFTGVKGFDTLRARAYHVFICKKLESSELTAQELHRLFP